MRPRFSLRFLLLAVLAIAIAFAIVRRFESGPAYVGIVVWLGIIVAICRAIAMPRR